MTDRYPPGTRVSASGGLNRPLIYAEVISDDGRRVVMRLKSGKEFWKGRSRVHKVSDAPEELERAPAKPAPVEWRQMGVCTADELEAKQPIRKPPGRRESRKYRAYVRTWPCLSCGSRKRIEASHHGSRAKSRKADDVRCVPLCWECHQGPRGFHQTGKLRGWPRLEGDALDAFLMNHMLDLVADFFWGSDDDELTTQREEDATDPGTD